MQGAVGGAGVGPFSSSGSMSTLSKEEDLVLSSEDSSSPDESELELGLGLSLSGASNLKPLPSNTGKYARILTAKDFPSVVPASASSSSSSSASSSSASSSLSRANVTAGTKRSADTTVGATNSPSRVVGWPPIRAYRMNSLTNQSKSMATEGFNSVTEKVNSINAAIRTSVDNGSDRNHVNGREKGCLGRSLFVKVNMDGIPIGRKVDLSVHGCYEALAQTLVDMFQLSSTFISCKRPSGDYHEMVAVATRPSKLLDGSYEFVLTYEDKDGDCMLAGDVPWGMFLNSVRRLKIMRTAEAKGLAPILEGKNFRRRGKPI